MFKKLHLGNHGNHHNGKMDAIGNSIPHSTPNSRFVPISQPSYHAVSGNNEPEYQSYRDSSMTMYSTYDTRESYVDPIASDQAAGFSRQTYIEPNTSTMVQSEVKPQSMYGAPSNDQYSTRMSTASGASRPSTAHLNFFNSESTDTLGSEFRPTRPLTPMSQINQGETPARMHHTYVDAPQPSTAVIIDNNTRASAAPTEDWDDPRATSRHHPQPLSPLVIPAVPTRSISSSTQQAHSRQNAYSPTQPGTSSHLYPYSQSYHREDMSNAVQHTPTTPASSRGGASPLGSTSSAYGTSPKTPPPNLVSNMMLPPSTPSPISPAVTPSQHAPTLQEKMQRKIAEKDLEPTSEAERLVSEGIQFHESGQLEKATECFRKASKMDSPIAMFLYGISLRHGWGCKKNEHAAFQYLQKAAEHAVLDLENLSNKVNKSASRGELVMAIYELGVSLRHGWGCRKNKEAAVNFFKIAADLGDPDAQNDLGHCYYKGQGVKKDLYLAAKYYRMADKQGNGIMGNSWIYKPKYDKPPKSS